MTRLWRIWLKTYGVWLQFLVGHNNRKNVSEYILTLNNGAICWKDSEQKNIAKLKLRGKMHCSIQYLQRSYMIVQVHWQARSGTLRWWSCCIVQYQSYSSCQRVEVPLAYQVFCITTTLFRKSIKVTSIFRRSTEKRTWPIHLLKLRYLGVLRWWIEDGYMILYWLALVQVRVVGNCVLKLIVWRLC